MFEQGKKYAFFPSVGAAWKIGEEDFMQDIDIISSLKLRGSYGIVGEQGVQAYNSLAKYTPRNVFFNQSISPAVILASLPSTGLDWEKTYQTDIGLEIGFENNRYSVEIDYYNKQTKDLLLAKPLPGTAGDTRLENIGQVENITEILNIGKEMLTHQLELLPGVEDTLKYLSGQFKLIMITKGDLFDQQRKIQGSGLSKYFSSIEIVSEKDEKAYLDILAKHGILPKNFIMVGNSLRSDILPVTKIGGTGIFIPHQYTWIHEKVDETQSANNYIKLKSILDLKLWLRDRFKEVCTLQNLLYLIKKGEQNVSLIFTYFDYKPYSKCRNYTKC